MPELPTPTPPPEDLENFIHRTLRAQPERTAPPSLEQRVLARLAAQAGATTSPTRSHARHSRWSEWSPATKGLFVAASSLTVLAMFQLFLSAHHHLTTQTLPALNFFTELTQTLSGIVARLTETIPPVWLYGTLAAVLIGYTALIGLGSLALRQMGLIYPANR